MNDVANRIRGARGGHNIGADVRSRPKVENAAAATALALCLVGLLGCGETPSCTKVGCRSGVTVVLGVVKRALPTARTVRLCVGARCATAPATTRLIEVEWPGGGSAANSATYVADVTVRDSQGRLLLRTSRRVATEKVEPNGRECEPTCFGAILQLDVAHKQLRPRGA